MKKTQKQTAKATKNTLIGKAILKNATIKNDILKSRGSATSKTLKNLKKEALQELKQETKKAKVLKKSPVTPATILKSFVEKHPLKTTKIDIPEIIKEKKVTLKSIVIIEIPKMLKGKKNGMKYSDIISAIQVLRPEATRNSVHGCIWGLCKNEFKGILKVNKGIYTLTQKKS